MISEKIFEYRKKRSLFDHGSDEYNRGPIKEKLELLALLHKHNELDLVIADYREMYKDKWHIQDSLKMTLRSLINHMREGDPILAIKADEMEVEGLVEVLKRELSNGEEPGI